MIPQCLEVDLEVAFDAEERDRIDGDVVDGCANGVHAVGGRANYDAIAGLATAGAAKASDDEIQRLVATDTDEHLLRSREAGRRGRRKAPDLW